jgi:hypothetical protein
MPARSNAQRQHRYCPQLESLEGRCIPATAGSAPGIPTTLAQVVAIARREEQALVQSLSTLQANATAFPAGSLSSALLSQNLQLTRVERSAVNRLIKNLQATKPAPAPAYLKVFGLQVSIANANAALQGFQGQEIVQGSASPFRVPQF